LPTGSPIGSYGKLHLKYPEVRIGRWGRGPQLSVHGTIEETGNMLVKSVLRVQASSVLSGPQTSWNVQLSGKTGDVASRARLTRVLIDGGCGCGCSLGRTQTTSTRCHLTSMVCYQIPSPALRIMGHDGKEAWVQNAPETPVRLGGVEVFLTDDVTLRVSWGLQIWVASDVLVQYSTDDERHGAG
jgi:hypothetical protein